MFKLIIWLGGREVNNYGNLVGWIGLLKTIFIGGLR